LPREDDEPLPENETDGTEHHAPKVLGQALIGIGFMVGRSDVKGVGERDTDSEVKPSTRSAAPLKLGFDFEVTHYALTVAESGQLSSQTV
jgi:hypothetical protein